MSFGTTQTPDGQHLTPQEQDLLFASQLPRVPTLLSVLQSLAGSLKACQTVDEFAEICRRIERGVWASYDPAQKTDIGMILYTTRQRLNIPWDDQAGRETGEWIDTTCKAYLAKEVHLAFQPPPTVPSPNPDPVMLRWVDVTAQKRNFGADDVWQVEEMEASLTEPFDDAFFRLRAAGNRKYRHPYLPTITFFALLKNGEEIRIGQSELSYTVADHLALASQEGRKEVEYVHADDNWHTSQAAWQHSPELRKHSPWERQLPEWFQTPEHWIDPEPPASCSLPERKIEGFWLPVPTLCFPVSGRLPLPSTLVPDLIPKTTYIPAKSYAQDPSTPSHYISIEKEKDVCIPSDRLTPPLTLDQAKSLLGRMIQWSDLEPGQEKYRTKYQSRELGYAFALDSRGMKLFVRNPHGHGLSGAYTLDLTETSLSVHSTPGESIPGTFGTVAQRVRDKLATPPGPWGLRPRLCMWVGPVSLPSDRDARGVRTGSTQDAALREASQKAAVDAYYSKIKSACQALNPPRLGRGKPRPAGWRAAFEVGRDGTLLVGDISACTTLEDFECVRKVREGRWSAGFGFLKPEDGQASYVGSVKCVNMRWLGPGTVDYSQPPSAEVLEPCEEAQELEKELENKKWEKLCTFSVDAGSCGILARSALSRNGFLRQKHIELETVLSTVADGGMPDSLYVRPMHVPGGVVCPAGPGDGAYDVLGKRDGGGWVVWVMCDFWVDWMKRQEEGTGDGDGDGARDEPGAGEVSLEGEE